MKNSNKSIIGVIGASVVMAVGVLLHEPAELDTNSNQLQVLIIHCDASPEGRDVKAHQVASYHTRPKSQGGRGWSKPGYNDFIERSGNVVNLISYNNDGVVQYSEIANGAVGYNRIARHVCYAGGMDSAYKNPKNTLTIAQDSAFRVYVETFVSNYPNARVAGHNSFAKKACPSFCVPTKLRSWGIPEKNIYKKPNLKKQDEKRYDSIVARSLNEL